ncbi:unnamed protein product [Hymenolepis diminuta]|uniref:HMG box domain-containing protein n=2 Tax=Hymenolepis diminuta TaxID=6216 RepID=A0A0R3SC15_HYMDI|nr:unnamed protein product [Hymenolepis diminuta]VUZ48398.1 unnamed protein product [Hymenolepis diminuta]
MHPAIVQQGKTLSRADARIPKPPKAPEKPLMPYMRYSRKVWERVKNENPQLKLWEVGRIIGQMWRELPDEEKNIYIEEYEAEKQRYNETLRQYHSSPAYQAWMVAKERAEKVIEEEERRNAARSREKHEPAVDMRESYILEDNDEDPDEQFTVKHVAAARYQRNHRLMLEILGDSKLPDPGQLINEHRIRTLQTQVKQLKTHKMNLCNEIENCELRHQAKMRRIQDESAVFYSEYRKLMIQTPRISDAQFAEMIIKAKQDMDKEEQKKRELQAAENEARKRRAEQREAELAEAERKRQAQMIQQQQQQIQAAPPNEPPVDDPSYVQAQYNRKPYPGVLQPYPGPAQQQSIITQPENTANSVGEPERNNSALVEEGKKDVQSNSSAEATTVEQAEEKVMQEPSQQQPTIQAPSVPQQMVPQGQGAAPGQGMNQPQPPPSNFPMSSNPQPPPPPEYQQYHQQQQNRYPPNYYSQGTRPQYPPQGGYPQQTAPPPPPSYPTSQAVSNQQQQMYPPSWQQHQGGGQSGYPPPQQGYPGNVMTPHRYPQPPPHAGGYQRPPYSEAPAPPPYQQQGGAGPVMHHPPQHGAYWQGQGQSEMGQQGVPQPGHYPVDPQQQQQIGGMISSTQGQGPQQGAPGYYHQGYGGAPAPGYGMPPSQGGVYFNGPPQQQAPLQQPPGAGPYGHQQPYMQPQQPSQHWPQQHQYPPGSYPQQTQRQSTQPIPPASQTVPPQQQPQSQSIQPSGGGQGSNTGGAVPSPAPPSDPSVVMQNRPSSNPPQLQPSAQTSPAQ